MGKGRRREEEGEKKGRRREEEGKKKRRRREEEGKKKGRRREEEGKKKGRRRHNLQRERAAILNEAAATAKEMGESGAEGVSVERDLMEVTEEGYGLEDPVTNEELLEA